MNTIKSIIKNIVMVAGLSAAVVFAQSWSGPTATPPENNTPAPINVSATSQAKSGGLWVGSLGVSGGATIGGSVGIGTANPQGQLDIASGQGGVNNSAIRATYPAGGGLTGTEFGALAHREGVWSALYAKQGAAGSAAYFDGNVGIGTKNPGAPLHVAGNAWFGPALAGLTGSLQTIFNAGSPIAVRTQFGTDGTGWQYRIAKNQNGAVTDLMTIKDNGDVGIGTVSPSQKLTVAGTIQSTSGGFMFPDGTIQTSASTAAVAPTFGGIYVTNPGHPTNTCERTNPVTGSCSCPSGYTAYEFIGGIDTLPSWGSSWAFAYQCWKL